MIERGRTTAVEGLSLRDSPRDGDIIERVPPQTELDILGRETWLRVRLPDGTVGFVLSDYVEAARPEATGDPHPLVDIVEFKSDVFVGNEVRCDDSFVPALRAIETHAGEAGVKVWVTSSLREPYKTVPGAIVDPAKLSNHHIGHAIDFNVHFEGELYRSVDLGKLAPGSKNKPLLDVPESEVPRQVRDFIQRVRSDTTHRLRWGGDFSTVDPVHIDDELNWLDREAYMAKLVSLWGEGVIERVA